jgi:hypothetical protein
MTDQRRLPSAMVKTQCVGWADLPAEVTAAPASEYYGALVELVKGVLDGNTEPAAYEDAAREMLGIRAYPAYTLDKLVSIAVRQVRPLYTFIPLQDSYTHAMFIFYLFISNSLFIFIYLSFFGKQTAIHNTFGLIVIHCS